MGITFDVQNVPLPCAGGAAMEVRASDPALRFFVTAQPIYQIATDGTLANPYTVLANVGIRSVVSVRDPGEAVYQPNPYDITEPGQLILHGASFTNVPLPHFIPASPVPGAKQDSLAPDQFNTQAYNAAVALAAWQQPALVHCSTGDRASAVFGVYLITSWGFSNEAALDFATKKLLLANEAFIGFLREYKKP